MLRKESEDRTEEALTYLEKALILDPQDIQSKLELGLCYEKKRDYPKAQSLLGSSRAATAGPNSRPRRAGSSLLLAKEKGGRGPGKIYHRPIGIRATNPKVPD